MPLSRSSDPKPMSQQFKLFLLAIVTAIFAIFQAISRTILKR